jgi:hypothetical protein
MPNISPRHLDHWLPSDLSADVPHRSPSFVVIHVRSSKLRNGARIEAITPWSFNSLTPGMIHKWESLRYEVLTATIIGQSMSRFFSRNFFPLSLYLSFPFPPPSSSTSLSSKSLWSCELCGVAMVGISIFATLVLSLFAFEAVSQSTTLRLDEVDLQVSSFLQLIHNESISTRGTSSRSLALSGCALAVRLVL